jgi:hypothetical protein
MPNGNEVVPSKETSAYFVGHWKCGVYIIVLEVITVQHTQQVLLYDGSQVPSPLMAMIYIAQSMIQTMQWSQY